jgi:sodium-dependent phosphate transporter
MGAPTSVDAKGDGADSDSTSLPSVYARQSSSAPTNQLSVSKKQPPEGPWCTPSVAFFWLRYGAFHGVEQEVVSIQSKRDFLSGDMEKAHATGEHFDNRAEYTYSFLQILTASTTSFAHCANDVSNAIGPYTTINWRMVAVFTWDGSLHCRVLESARDV